MLAVPQAHSILELLKILLYCLDIFKTAKARGPKVRSNFHGFVGGSCIIAKNVSRAQSLFLASLETVG